MPPATCGGSSTCGPSRPSELGADYPLGPGLREPRRGDGCLQSRTRTARSGPGRRCRAAGPTGRREPGRATPRRPVGACCSTTSARSPAGRGSSSRATSGWSSCRSGPPGRSRRSSSRSGRPPACRTSTTPRATRWPRRCVELLGRYDGLFRRPFPYSMGWHQAPFGGIRRHRRLAGPRPLLPAAAARATCASSWSATSCWPRPSATSRRRTPRASARAAGRSPARDRAGRRGQPGLTLAPSPSRPPPARPASMAPHVTEAACGSGAGDSARRTTRGSRRSRARSTSIASSRPTTWSGRSPTSAASVAPGC